MQQHSSTELVFIDRSIANADALAAAVPTGMEVVWLESGSDPWQQMTDAIASHTGISAIHLVSHASEGELTIAGITYSAADLAARSGLLNSWQDYLADGADILLYGCNLGAGVAGSNFIQQLSQLTGADVAASTDTTGNLSLGGNWDLETSTGSIEATPLALDQAGWQGILPGNPVFDVAGNLLVFNGYSTESGIAGQNGSVVRYNNVITIGGQAIDAVITTTLAGASISGFDLAGSTSGVSDSNFELDTLDVSGAAGSATFDIQFYLQGTTTAVTLQNVVINSYDIDLYQYQDFKGFSDYQLVSTGSILSPQVLSNGTVRFQSNSTSTFNSSDDISRVQVFYDSISHFQLTSGISDTSISYAAFASLAFQELPFINATTYTTPAPRITYSTTVFQEAAANNGSVLTTASIELINAYGYGFVGNNGDDLIATGKVTVSNVPAGLTAVLIKTSATTATLSYTGNAASHIDADDVNNVSVNFLDTAFTSGLSAASVSGSSRADLAIDFNPIFTINPSLSANDILVNEASPFAVFTISNNTGSSQTASLNLANITAIGNGVDYGDSTTTHLQYSSDNGVSWSDYQSGTPPTIAANGSLLVRTPVINDNVFEGAETFNLIATPAVGYGAMGTATIMDDGTGSIFNADGSINNTALHDNDQPVTITSPSVNEASPYAVFTLASVPGQVVSLALADGSALGSGQDYGSATSANLQYSVDNGVTWQDYTSAVTFIGTTILVRTPLTNDNVYEGQETFTLTAFRSAVIAAVGTATIHDDASGTVFNANGSVDNTLPPDNDTPMLSVSSVTVSEASPYAIVQVALSHPGTAPVVFTPSLISATGTVGTDTGSSLEYFTGNAWLSAAAGVTVPAGSTSVFLRTSIVNDDIYEGLETVIISTGPITGDVLNTGAAIGTVTIADDGSNGNVFNANSNSPIALAGEANDDRKSYDNDSVPESTETGLAQKAGSSSGDLNGDGIPDAQQGAVATLAWINSTNFENAIAGNLSLVPVNSIITMQVENASGGVDEHANFELIKVIATASLPIPKPSTVTAPWDPISYAVTPLAGTILNDADSSRTGTQQKVVINIANAGLDAGTFNRYMVYLSADTIASYAAANKALTDLDGHQLNNPSQAGWYDFTARTTGGDGARYLTEHGKITGIEITNTDGAFGDSDVANGQFFDYGMPVFAEQQTLLSDQTMMLADGIDNLTLNNITRFAPPKDYSCMPDWMVKMAGGLPKTEKVVANLNGTGNSWDNNITGNNGNNKLLGLDGNDNLYGLKGQDLLIGGSGADQLYGGAGNDIFKYLSITDSLVGNVDMIGDFQRGHDKIDLRALDANAHRSGNQAFKLVNTFSHQAGQLHFNAGTHMLQGDTNGDGSADFTIEVIGIAKLTTLDILL